MTVPDLIERILGMLENQFYGELPRGAFNRDLRFLINAIGTYGYESSERGWEFDVPFIYRELSTILTSFKRSGTDIKWMPNYLQHAIRQHIREHAEELSASAKAIGALTKRTVAGVAPVQVVIEKSDVEVLASVHKDVNRLRRRTHAERRAQTAEQKRQKDLL